MLQDKKETKTSSPSVMSYLGKTILPQLVWLDGKVHENVPIEIDSDGTITEIGGTIPYDVERLPDEVRESAHYNFKERQ
uniref:Mandelate racemase/muconate lactonizing enzyme family protein n=1 Tax=Angiostrongylus cantonensis TaxID=6313 RepID=A0A0K0D5Y8_ANGCA